MRKLVLLVPLAVVLLGASTAYANFTHVGASVRVMHGTNEVASYVSQDLATGSALTPCSTLSCEVVVPVKGRDLGRVLKWCGGNAIVRTINPPNSTGLAICQGPSDWTVRVGMTLNDCSGVNCVLGTSDQNVLVTVDVVDIAAI